MKEIWKDIEGYEGVYQVSTHGRVKRLIGYRCKTERMLALNFNHGYSQVTLCKDGVHDRRGVHRIVAMAFIPNPDNKPFINHIKNNSTLNNRLDNIEWCTQSENMIHAVATGLKGKKNKKNLSCSLAHC